MAVADGSLIKALLAGVGVDYREVTRVEMLPQHLEVHHLIKDEEGKIASADSFRSYFRIDWPLDAEDA